MVKLRNTYSILFFFIAAITAIAQSVTVQAPRSVVEGNIFQVVFELDNARAEDIQVGKIDGCTELSGPGVTSSSSITIINGQRSEKSTTGYAYTYRAVKSGTYTIPAATLKVGGKTIQSKPVQIKVLPPDEDSGQTSHGQGYGNNNPSSTATDMNISSKDIFVRIIFNKAHVYEGEAVECILKLYTRYNSISGIRPNKLPIFDGFLIEEVDATSQDNEIEHYNGQNYLTAILKKYIIFPSKAGKLTVTSGEYTVGVTTMQRVSNGFWGYTNIPVEQNVELRPTSATLNISTLPSPAPASFNGAVGKFTLESRLSTDQFKTNEAASLTTIITGTGNIKYVKCPLPQLPVDFEQYTPSEDVRTHVAGNSVTGTVTSELTFVPQCVGKFNIPATEFSYFDPTRKEYVTLSTDSYNIEVARGAGATVGTNVQNEIKQRATDILHIHQLKSDSLKQGTTHQVVYSVGFWLAWIAIIIVAIASLAFYKYQLKRNADVIGMKTARAGRVAKKRLRQAKVFLQKDEKEKFYAEILTALWGYISDRLVIPVSDLTRANVADKLSSKGLSNGDIDRVISILDECEMSRYTPDASSHTLTEIYNETSDIMDILERIKK